jgi:hypothetical protein
VPLESLYDLGFQKLQSRLEADGVRPIHGVQLWKLLYRELESEPLAREDLSPLKSLAQATPGKLIHAFNGESLGVHCKQ